MSESIKKTDLPECRGSYAVLCDYGFCIVQIAMNQDTPVNMATGKKALKSTYYGPLSGLDASIQAPDITPNASPSITEDPFLGMLSKITAQLGDSQ